MIAVLVWGAPDLPEHTATTRGWILVKLRRTRITSGLIVLALVISVPLATTALADPTVEANITGDPVDPGVEATLTLTITPEVETTLDSFTLTPPANWQLVSDEDSPSPGGTNYTIDGNTLVGSDLSETEYPATVEFKVKTGCVSGNWAWTLVAQDPENNEFGNGESDLTTDVNEDCTLAITTEPTDAAKDTLITGTAFDSSSNFVSVALKNGEEEPQTVTYFPVDVTFDLATGTGLATGSLTAGTKTTVDGVATFSGPAATLKISTPNQPFVTEYRLTPKTVGTYAGLTGANSAGFDIWGAGCKGSGCSVSLTPGTSSDAYTTSENVGMGASQLGLGGTNISCPTQQLIFSTNLFFHATTNNAPNAAPVFLVSHISAADRKAVANNGNKVMGWCVGLKTPGPWNFARQNTNGIPGLQAGDLYVGMAPKCPNKNASSKAPCIVSQNGDGVGGTFIRGWLPGGDPPRRT